MFDFIFALFVSLLAMVAFSFGYYVGMKDTELRFHEIVAARYARGRQRRNDGTTGLTR